MFLPLLALLACGLHLGEPPLQAGLRPGRVEVPVAEPELGDLLAEALAAAIRRSGAAGELPVDVRVEEARFEPSAVVGGEVVAWEAELALRFTRLGPEPLELRLSRSELVTVGGAEELSARRAEAFAELGELLAREAVELLARAPAVGEAR